MSEDNKALVHRFLELLALDRRVPEELLGPGFIYHVPESPPLDLKATKQRAATFIASFSDARHFLEDMIAEGDRVAFRTRLEMRHTGEFMGVAGSDAQISVIEWGFIRVVNGKIAEMWGLLDTMGLMKQVGLLPAKE